MIDVLRKIDRHREKRRYVESRRLCSNKDTELPRIISKCKTYWCSLQTYILEPHGVLQASAPSWRSMSEHAPSKWLSLLYNNLERTPNAKLVSATMTQ